MKRFRLNDGTFAVLLMGLLIVAWYAFEAYCGNIVDENHRPPVSVVK